MGFFRRRGIHVPSIKFWVPYAGLIFLAIFVEGHPFGWWSAVLAIVLACGGFVVGEDDPSYEALFGLFTLFLVAAFWWLILGLDFFYCIGGGVCLHGS